MDPITIGKKIKEAYPQYAKRDDAELGTKYLEKYGGAVSSIQSGKLRLVDVPESQRIGVSIGLNALQVPTNSVEESKPAAKDVALASSGLTNLKDVKSLYEKDPSVLLKQLIPGQFFSREYDTAAYDTADALLRLRTGAQANPAEIRGYMKKIAPSFGDSPKVVKYKLEKLGKDLESYLGKNLSNQNSNKVSKFTIEAIE